ncbi:MAG: transcription termination factor NusA [Clostridia bacterium]
MINKDFFAALEDLEVEKKINKEIFLQTLESALTAAYKKTYGEAKSALVKLYPDKSAIRIFSYKTVVETVEDEDKEISLEDAQKDKKSAAIGDIVQAEESTKDFGRIAAQTAKQVVMQKIKEIERQRSLSELAEKEDALLTSIVKRIDNGTIFVSIPGSTTEGAMMTNDQIPNERFDVGDKIRVYVKKITDSFRGTSVQVSRSHIGFVKKLFELEIPEIANGEVQIKNIVRDPGNRTKIAVFSDKPNVDAIGACLGVKGSRLSAVMAELGNEKIDLVQYSTDPLEYIASALSPVKVLSVETNDSLKASRVIVPDDKLSLAIGRGGQNVRLAARLTGWKIDVKTESTVKEEQNAKAQEEYEITEIDENNEVNFDEFEDITE